VNKRDRHSEAEWKGYLDVDCRGTRHTPSVTLAAPGGNSIPRKGDLIVTSALGVPSPISKTDTKTTHYSTLKIAYNYQVRGLVIITIKSRVIRMLYTITSVVLLLISIIDIIGTIMNFL
jgi:hypothetical protein